MSSNTEAWKLATLRDLPRILIIILSIFYNFENFSEQFWEHFLRTTLRAFFIAACEIETKTNDKY